MSLIILISHLQDVINYADGASNSGWNKCIESSSRSFLKHSRIWGVPLLWLTIWTTAPVHFDNICKIWGFHGGGYEECRLLGCGAV
jgi:hypothetical protein